MHAQIDNLIIIHDREEVIVLLVVSGRSKSLTLITFPRIVFLLMAAVWDNWYGCRNAQIEKILYISPLDEKNIQRTITQTAKHSLIIDTLFIAMILQN